MNSLSDAADTINGTDSEAGIEALLASLGFAESPLPLDATIRHGMGLPAAVLSARVSRSDGVLRALSVEVAPDADIQTCIAAVARRLAAWAPQLLWLVVARKRGAATLAIATWRSSGAAPRTCAMITERGRVVDSDAETLCSLAAASAVTSDVLRHMRWLDILGRDAVTRRFFAALSGAIATLADSMPERIAVADRREIAILTASRLLFLAFLETKGWLDGDFGFLANGFSDCMASGGGYQRRVLEPLFFGTLNTQLRERAPRARAFGRVPFLNGGLFSRTTVERIHRHSRMTDDAMGILFGDVLVRYRFTAREDASTWSQAAIDPEMLGKVFESLMESGARKRGGVYYTPQRFVERLTFLTLASALERCGIASAKIDGLLGDQGTAVEQDEHDPRILDCVKNLTILDPACGSGAFLVHVMERLAHIRSSLGDHGTVSEVRRAVLARSIFGVDSNATAVWLCELRLWLSSVIDSDERDPMRVTPLPNLDRQIRVGDSLSGDSFAVGGRKHPASGKTSALRGRYVRATGRRKATLGRRLDVLERERALASVESALATARFERREIIRATRARDLFDVRTPPSATLRDRLFRLRATMRALGRSRTRIARGEAPAFDYRVHFADVAESGGFDAIIGNPPWVRVHNIPPEARARYREHFSVFRAGAWGDGARGASATSGFAGQTDLAALFLERSTELVAPDGILGLLLPSKLWRSLAGGGARQLVLSRTHVVAIEDHADGPDAFEAAVYPSMLVAARKAANADESTLRVAVQRRDTLSQWTLPGSELALDTSPGSPWLLLPPPARAAFDRLTRSGVPLFESVLRRPHLGVKTGCNEAYVVRAEGTRCCLATIHSGSRHAEIESHSLRPLVRGESLTRWRIVENDERIIWTHDDSGAPVAELPARTHRWLSHWRRTLESRSDSRSERWWSLFRVDAAQSKSARVAWCDFGREPRAAVIDAGDPVIPLNTCYWIACPRADDALAFCALLNSDIASAWLAVLAEPARGGFHRYLGWTVARLPIPIDWPRARRLLAPLAERAMRDDEPSQLALREAVLKAYDLTASGVGALLEWTDACKNA